MMMAASHLSQKKSNQRLPKTDNASTQNASTHNDYSPMSFFCLTMFKKLLIMRIVTTTK